MSLIITKNKSGEIRRKFKNQLVKSGDFLPGKKFKNQEIPGQNRRFGNPELAPKGEKADPGSRLLWIPLDQLLPPWSGKHSIRRSSLLF